MSYIYLASPYSHEDAVVRHNRFLAAVVTVGELMHNGKTIYSPIAHNHEVFPHLPGAPTDINFWWRHNRNMLRHADYLIVLQLPGWQASKGVKKEIYFARQTIDIMVEYIWPSEAALGCLR